MLPAIVIYNIESKAFHEIASITLLIINYLYPTLKVFEDFTHLLKPANIVSI